MQKNRGEKNELIISFMGNFVFHRKGALFDEKMMQDFADGTNMHTWHILAE